MRVLLLFLTLADAAQAQPLEQCDGRSVYVTRLAPSATRTRAARPVATHARRENSPAGRICLGRGYLSSLDGSNGVKVGVKLESNFTRWACTADWWERE